MKTARATCFVLLSGFALASTGCATILSGKYQAVTIHSVPSGAQVRVADQSGITPVTLYINKNANDPIVVSHGPDRRVLSLQRSLDPMTLLNVVPPLWPGFFVDASTGALRRYDPDVIRVDFRTADHVRDAQLVRCKW